MGIWREPTFDENALLKKYCQAAVAKQASSEKLKPN